MGSTTSGRAVQFGDNLWSYQSYVTVYGRSPELEITSWLSAQSSGLGYQRAQVTDAFNTATFSFYAAPQDMTFTSASGTFLTAVPEPRSLALLLAGLGYLWLLPKLDRQRPIRFRAV